MCRPFRDIVLSIITIWVCATPAWAQRSSVGAILVQSDQCALVSGEVIDVRDIKKGVFRATVEIMYVYSGPRSLKKLALFDYTAEEVFSDHGGTATPLLKLEEKGLWVLSIDRNTGTWFVSGRYRKDHLTNYDQRVEWAEAIERLVKLDVTKRLKLAQDLCGERTPLVAKLGIEVLIEAKPDDAKLAGVPEFLKELPKNRDVTASALVRADRLWFERDGKEWLTSDRRKTLLERLTEPLTEDDAAEVAAHVIQTRHLQSPRGVWFTAQEATALLTKLATDPRQPKTVRRTVIEKVVKTAENAGVKPDFTFDILLTVLRTAGDDGVRLQAAEGCGRLVKGISGPQLDTVIELLKNERNADVAKALQTAIDKSKSK